MTAPIKPKKVGIVCDTYKLPFFEAALKEAGFLYTVHGNRQTAPTMMMKVEAKEGDMEKIAEICRKVEFKFADKKRKFN